MLILSRQSFGQRLDGAFEFRQVVVDGGPHDRVIGVEIAVRQAVAHACDLALGDAGLGDERLGGQGLYRFAYFQQPYTDSVEYQAVG